MTYQLGHNQKHIYTQGDEGVCPHCYSPSTSIGTININGLAQDSRKCNSCNSLFSGVVKGGIDGILREAATVAHTSSTGVTWISNGTTSGNTITIGNNAGSVYNPMSVTVSNQYQIEEKLDNINSSVQSLQWTINELTRTIKELAEQNKQLQEKVHTDPLIAIRKALNDFNLN